MRLAPAAVVSCLTLASCASAPEPTLKPVASADPGSLREEMADIAGLSAGNQWYLTHGDPHMAGQSAEALIMAARHVIAVHDQELREKFQQSGPVSIAQVLGQATHADSPEAYLNELRDEISKGRMYSPNPVPAAPQPPAVMMCDTIDGVTDCIQ
jgi:hypothetical protein